MKKLRFMNGQINNFRRSDTLLWLVIFIISIFSLILIKSVSRDVIDYFTTQLIAILVGLIGAVILQSINYEQIAKGWLWIAFFCIVLVVYTLFFGITIEGMSGVNARAWIKLPGGINFQPSELVKIGFIITFSKHIDIIKKNNALKKFRCIMFLAFHALVPIILTHLQGDDGAAIIFMFITLFIMFNAGVQIRYFVVLIVSGIVSFPLIWKYILADYQKQRLLNQLNPEADPLNMGYQQIQGKLSIGSGGLFGTGLFNGSRVEDRLVPIQESDFIFSVVGEELGFLGCILVLLLIFFLIARIFVTAKKSNNFLGSAICFGYIGLIASQTIFNLGMCLSLLPVMGVTLPFFSAGGSSVACLYIGIGIIQNIFLKVNERRRFGNKSEVKLKVKRTKPEIKPNCDVNDG